MNFSLRISAVVGDSFRRHKSTVFPSPFIQLAEVKVRVLEAKQALEDCITAQEFSRAAELKDSITNLENQRNQILQEISESSQPAEKEVRIEKVRKKTEGSTCVTE